MFYPYIGVLSGYEEGLPTRDLQRLGGPFQEIEGGLKARRAGRRAELRLDYQFDLRHYTPSSRLDRSQHGVNLDTRFRLSPRLMLMLRDVGASSSFGDFSGPADHPGAGFVAAAGPEAFHARTIANTALADLVFSPTADTSFSFGGDGFVIQRQFNALIDAVGWRARAELARRYCRHKTVSLSYSFTHFDHSRNLGGADYTVYAVGHSWRRSKSSELDLLAGAGILRSAGTGFLQLDPEVARLLGASGSTEVQSLHTWAPHLAAAWLQSIGRAELRLELSHLVSDGGGLSGLARQSQGTLTLRAAHSRAWRPEAMLSLQSYHSLDTLLYRNTTVLGGGGIARRWGPRAEAVLRYQFAFYNYPRGLLRDFHRHQVSAGVVYYFRDWPSR
ncbi:MAG: hypothetical protein HY236_04010 [Acidobacteria bacterium]|nr:hypothetical protein [Acidobacteriota bacterium]